MLNQWTAEEVEKHLTAASILREEQVRAGGEITIVFETLEVVNITLHHLFRQLTKDTEDLKQRLSHIREHYQAHNWRDQEQEQNDGSGSSQYEQ